MENNNLAQFGATVNLAKRSVAKQKFTSVASIENLKNLKSLLPSSAEMVENDDLLYTVFNIAVTNLINLNGDGITNETAVQMAKTFVNRPMNIEHDKYNIVGVITNYGFSNFTTNELVSEEDVLASSDPFNISLSAIVWKYNSPFFAEYLCETQEEENWCYEDISTSWEIAFDSYVIARGSKNLANAEIISDPVEVKRLSVFLTANGGSGFDDKNVEVYRVLSGTPRPLGGGFVSNPAAPVKGVLTIDIEEEKESMEIESDDMKDDNHDEMDDQMEEMDSKKTDKISKCSNKNEKSEEKISQSQKINVRNIKYMKFNNIDEMYSYLADASANKQEFSAKSVHDFVANQIKEADKQWDAQVKARESEIAELKASIQNAQTAIDELKLVKQELEDTKTAIAEQEIKNIVNDRISVLDSQYELTPKMVTLIAKSIAGKSDEEYAEWLSNDGEVILAGREKASTQEPVKVEDAVKTATASTEPTPPCASTHKDNEEQKERRAQVSTKGAKIELSFN